LILAGRDGTAEIVVAGNENPAVKQAADFLAGDIEKISGKRPPVVDSPDGDRISIRLVTLDNLDVPAPIDAEAMRGQWESYRIVTAGRTVWLVGSNPRGTAFAAYTLSERLGIDPLYIWTGYLPQHRDPLVLKRTTFAQAHQPFDIAAFSMMTKTSCRGRLTPTDIRCRREMSRWTATKGSSRPRSACG
jgi:hypothetical protein